MKNKTRTKKVKISDSKKHNFHTMKSSNLSLGIKRLPYSRMLKSEMADFVEKTIGIFEAHDPDSVMLNPMFDLLLAKTPDIKLLRLSFGIDTERLRENKLKAEMMLQISAFKLKVRMLTRSNLELDLHVIQNAINSHLRLLNKCRNDKELSQKIAGFHDLMLTNLELQESITEFDLSTEANNIVVAYTNLTDASQKRVKLLSKRPAIDTKAITKGMVKTIDNLFKAIEVSHLVNIVDETGKEIDLIPLMDELNQLSDMYHRSISIRDANNKRKAMQEEENSKEDTPDANGLTEPDDSGGAIVSSFRATNAPAGPISDMELPTDSDNDESDKSIDHEKPFELG